MHGMQVSIEITLKHVLAYHKCLSVHFHHISKTVEIIITLNKNMYLSGSKAQISAFHILTILNLYLVVRYIKWIVQKTLRSVHTEEFLLKSYHYFHNKFSFKECFTRDCFSRHLTAVACYKHWCVFFCVVCGVVSLCDLGVLGQFSVWPLSMLGRHSHPLLALLHLTVFFFHSLRLPSPQNSSCAPCCSVFTSFLSSGLLMKSRWILLRRISVFLL